MTNQSALNLNITNFFNNMMMFSYPNELSDIPNGRLFDKIINLSYNSYNETVYIETTEHYYIMEVVKGIAVRVTEFDKTKGSASDGL